MSKDFSASPTAGFPHLLAVMSGERFLQKQGLNNEVPFYICPFDPTTATEMERMVKQLIEQLARQGVQVLEINLYDLAMDYLQQRGIWERVLEFEKTNPKEALKELLQSVLDPEAQLTPLIAAKMEATPFHILFVTGVGEVFPYIRSHNVLNNLHSTAKNQPTVLFFPGEYKHDPIHGASLKLFGRLTNDKYYRAYNIYETQPYREITP